MKIIPEGSGADVKYYAQMGADTASKKLLGETDILFICGSFHENSEWGFNYNSYVGHSFYNPGNTGKKNIWTAKQDIHTKILITGSYNLFYNGSGIANGTVLNGLKKGDTILNIWDYNNWGGCNIIAYGIL